MIVGSCSSPVERLAEAQRGAGSIPAGAIMMSAGISHGGHPIPGPRIEGW